MMKTVLLFAFLFSVAVAQANDTITRAQVYNFNVGDTFEYETSRQTSQVFPFYNAGPITTTSFRQTITSIYYSANSDTLFVVKTPGPVNFFFAEASVPNAVNFYSDTLAITNLGSYEIYYHYYGGHADTTYVFADTLNSRRTNGTICNGSLGLYYTEDIFGEGLGIVSQYQAGGDGYYRTELRVALKYYSKDNETWGVSLPVGINAKDIRQKNSDANLSPNPFSTQLTFSLALNEPTTVTLYNFLGQQVLQKSFTNTTTLNTEQLQHGIYFYELRNNKGALKNGKILKQ